MSYEMTWILLLAVSSAVGQKDSDVRLPPTITEQTMKLEEIFSAAGASKELSCVANAMPPVTPDYYTWKKNGQPLDLNDGHIQKVGEHGNIRFEELSSLDEGYYQCYAENIYGIALSNKVHFRRAKLFIESNTPPKVKNAREGSHLTIPCEGVVSVPAHPTYGWSLATTAEDPHPNSITFDARVNIDPTGTLHFAFTQKEDEREGRLYVCGVYNPYQRQTSHGSQYNITISSGGDSNSMAPNVVYATEDFVALEGTTMELSCLFSGSPAPSVSWEKVNGSLPAGRFNRERSNTKLSIQPVKRDEDPGTYRCTGDNDAGRETRDIVVTVKSAPKFTKGHGLRDKNVTEGDDVVFECVTDADPPADVVWFKNGKTFGGATRMTISEDRTRLTVSKACKVCHQTGTSDLMVLQCNASNIYGYAFGSGYLNVLKRTKIVQGPTNVTLEYGKDVVFTCNTTSDDSTTVSVDWQINGETIIPDQTRLIIGDNYLRIVTSNDEDKGEGRAGNYTCVADNGYSRDTYTTTLDLPPGPRPTADTIIVAEAGIWWWWIIIVVVIVLLLLLVILICCLCLNRDDGDMYNVDEKERQMGNDPEEELFIKGFHEFQRAPVKAHKGSRASLSSTTKLDASDDDRSIDIADFGEFEAGKFNEDGSFIGQYTGPRKH